MLNMQQEVIDVNTEIVRDYREIQQNNDCNKLNDNSQFMFDMDIHVKSGGNEEENGNCVTEDNQVSETEQR
jgi:hypothetical protein